MPVVIAGTHFAQNLEIRLTQVKFGHYFQVPVINAGTHFAQNPQWRLASYVKTTNHTLGISKPPTEFNSPWRAPWGSLPWVPHAVPVAEGDGHGVKCLYILL